jgi:hypothetical protein
MRQCAFASKQLATEFAFKVLDGTRQGWLCHVAALCGLGQIQRLADRQEVSDMVHFHSTTLATLLRINTDLLGCRHDHLSQTKKLFGMSRQWDKRAADGAIGNQTRTRN